jgi:hypothetical protein
MISSEVQGQLDEASSRLGFQSRRASHSMQFEANVCGNEWDRFIEQAAGMCFTFIQDCLGPFQRMPRPVILTIEDGFHSAGANASFEPGTGQVRLCADYIQGRPGTTLEKVCHELTHASLNDFPEGDPFYEEGFVDYSVWVMSHAPWWGDDRESMIQAAAHNIAMRRDKATRDLSDYDRKRWAGGLFCSTVHGPWVLSKLRMAKAEGNLQW